MAGFLSKIMVYPMDLAKKRMQIQGFGEHRKSYGTHFSCNGMWDCFRNTVRQEGLLGEFNVEIAKESCKLLENFTVSIFNLFEDPSIPRSLLDKIHC